MKIKWIHIRICGLGLLAALATTYAIRKHFSHLVLLDGISISGGKAMSVRIDIEPYLQYDSRWSTDVVGSSGGTLGGIGCTICATSMALTSQGFEIQPGELNDKLNRSDGYTDSGLLIWKAITDLTEGKFEVSIVNRPTHRYLDAQLEAGNPLIAKVLYQDAIWHWVLITGKEGDDYLMHDPLGNGVAHDRMDEFPRGIYAVRHLRL